jgi:hypothetical protein
MQGRRIHVVEGSDPYQMVTQPGDYYGPVFGFNGDSLAVYFLLPTATPSDPKWGGGQADGLHAVCSPPHRFKEETDGSLTIRESIGCGGPAGQYYWHGYLNHGCWELTLRD